MGLTVAPGERYESAIKKLFPQGTYWDEQFADPASDVSLFAKAKLDALIRFRTRMGNLLDEGKTETAEELIADWERVLLDTLNAGKPVTERRLLLKSRENDSLNHAELQKIADIFGLYIKDIIFPHRPRFFGFAKLAQERIGSFTAFSVLKITATEDALELKHWQIIKAEMERHRFAGVHFGQERLAYFPAYKRREIVYRKLRRGCFGHGRFAQNTLAPFPIDEARQTALARLGAKRITNFFSGKAAWCFLPGALTHPSCLTRIISAGISREFCKRRISTNGLNASCLTSILSAQIRITNLNRQSGINCLPIRYQFFITKENNHWRNVPQQSGH
jgi:uncharacterized protein YmfQ (DUF2313 family)